METVTVHVVLEVPRKLVPMRVNRSRALKALLTGALAEFRVVVTEVQMVPQDKKRA